MRRYMSMLLAALALVAGAPADQAPDTEIYLAPLRLTAGGVTVGALRNITQRVGYDNQPHFTRDGKAILYTARIDDAQTEIFRYDVQAGRATRLTATPESEYSPTPLAAGGFSVIRVEADSTQRLWRFDDAGSNPSLLLPGVKPVGYQAWIDDQTVAVFVLGSPTTLRLANVRSGATDSIAANIGRALQKIPNWPGVSFVQRAADSTMWVRRVRAGTGTTEAIAKLPAGGEYHAWTAGGMLLATSGSRLFRWVATDGPWQEVADFSTQGIRVSRLAISPAGDWIALVGEAANR